MIIRLLPNPNGSHDNQSTTVHPLPHGWVELPPELEEAFTASGSFCTVVMDDGVPVGITPLPIPEPEPVSPVIDPLTETQLAMAELAQVVEDNNTATQLAIAELAGALLGG